jgi:hypothetical protein
MVNYLLKQIRNVLRNEEGIETLEWIAMAFLIIVLLAVVVYPGSLQGVIQAVIGNIQTHLGG